MNSQKRLTLEVYKNSNSNNIPNLENINTNNEIPQKQDYSPTNKENNDNNLDNSNLETNYSEISPLTPLNENYKDSIDSNTQESEQKDKEALIKNIFYKTNYLNNQYAQSIDTLKSITESETPVQNKLFEFLIQSELQSKINSQLEINENNLNNDKLEKIDINQLNKINQNLDNIKNNNLELFQKINSLQNLTEENFEALTQGIYNSLNQFDLDSSSLKQYISLNESNKESKIDYLDQKTEVESNLLSNIKEIKEIYLNLKNSIKNSIAKNPSLKNPSLKDNFIKIYIEGNVQKNILSSMDSVNLIENSLDNLDFSKIKTINNTIVDLKAKFNQFLISNNELIGQSSDKSVFDSKSQFLINTSEDINQSFNLLKEKIN